MAGAAAEAVVVDYSPLAALTDDFSKRLKRSGNFDLVGLKDGGVVPRARGEEEQELALPLGRAGHGGGPPEGAK